MFDLLISFTSGVSINLRNTADLFTSEGVLLTCSYCYTNNS